MQRSAEEKDRGGLARAAQNEIQSPAFSKDASGSMGGTLMPGISQEGIGGTSMSGRAGGQSGREGYNGTTNGTPMPGVSQEAGVGGTGMDAGGR